MIEDCQKPLPDLVVARGSGQSFGQGIAQAAELAMGRCRGSCLCGQITSQRAQFVVQRGQAGGVAARRCGQLAGQFRDALVSGGVGVPELLGDFLALVA